MKLVGRVAVLVALLAVPLGLALASQALAGRPGPPRVPSAPVTLSGDTTPGGNSAPKPSSPGASWHRDELSLIPSVPPAVESAPPSAAAA